MPKLRPAVALTVMCLGASPAHAGRSSFGWLLGTEVTPERGVELQTWMFEQNGKPGNVKQASLWWGPLIGVTGQLELALPVELGRVSSDAASAVFSLRRFGVEARYRLAPPGADAPAFVPLVRVAVKRDVVSRDALHLEANLVASFETGRVQLLADAGVTVDITPGGQRYEVHPGAGVSILATDELRVGAEAYAELEVHGEAWAIAGPNLSWTHGRFWVTAMYGFGVYHIDNAPRVVWGVAF
jgi:hypothetical protein